MPDRPSIRTTLVTANIGRKGATATKVRDNIHKIRMECPGALIGFQEIDDDDPAQELDIVDERFRGVQPGGFRYAFAGHSEATPIAVPSTWTITSQSVKKTCEGRAHVTPHRVVVTARCRLTSDDSFPPVVFMNGHYPFHAPDLWADCQQSWKEHVREIHDAGFTIITTRDTNRHGPMPKVHPQERQLLSSGIDRISVIPAPESSPHRVRVRAFKRPPVNLDIDGHDARAVDIRFTSLAD
jgi:riboflavin biosynthesis pyrimidine reductase